MTTTPITAEAVVFDLDGTLADTPNAIVTITRKVLTDLGRPADDAAIRATVGKPLDRNFAQLLDLPADHPDVVGAMAAYRQGFVEHLAAVGVRMLYPGVPEGLAKLRESGRRLAIATSKTHDAAVRTLQGTGIAELFDVVAGHDDVTAGKPAPDMALLVAGGLGVEPTQCVVVGDGVSDIEMARAAGMATIGVSYGVATAEELRAAGADMVVHTFDDVIATSLS